MDGSRRVENDGVLTLVKVNLGITSIDNIYFIGLYISFFHIAFKFYQSSSYLQKENCRTNEAGSSMRTLNFFFLQVDVERDNM